MKTLAFFNARGGVGKTTLTFNVAHMMTRLGYRVVAADLDPQCDLTAMMLPDEELVDLWERSQDPHRTGASCVGRVLRGDGELRAPRLLPVPSPASSPADLWLLPGDPALVQSEPTLANAWATVDGDDRALPRVTSIERLLHAASRTAQADVVIVDVGPGLTALNRAALIACDAVVVPVAPDLFSLQGLRSSGPSLRAWRDEWVALAERLRGRHPDLPVHAMSVLGYVIPRHVARSDRPLEGHRDWIQKIPTAFHEHVIGRPAERETVVQDDVACLARLEHFSSLVPIAQLSRKPLFDLRASEGIGGGQLQSVARARTEFADLSRKIAVGLGLEPPKASAALPVGRGG